VLPAKGRVPDRFRLTFASPALETFWAFLVFGVLLLSLVGLAGRLAFRETGLRLLNERLEVVTHEAESIARTVNRIGLEGGSIDFSRIRRNQAVLHNYIEERLTQRFFLHHVEILDRFGVRQLFVARTADQPEPPPIKGSVPRDWPGGAAGEHVVRVPLGRADGEVRVALHAESVLRELRQRERSLRLKLAVAFSLAVIVVVAGFFYVLYLVRKNRMLEQARQSASRASYVGLLASGLAHEIRNPLNAMNMNLQMLEEELQGLPESEDGEYRELLDSTKREIKRLEGLVNNFLAYARPASPSFERKNLNEVVTEVVRFLEVDFRQSKVELNTDLEPLLPTVELDEIQFKQALINLLVNARQVLKAGGHVRVRTRAGSGGEVVVEIEDDGPGIPAEARERIFEVFYSSRGGGTGLGLPIARQIVERHGGTIGLESVEGQGTTFRIRLRRRHDELDHAAEAAT
jgi:signal transduction histidine kinase